MAGALQNLAGMDNNFGDVSLLPKYAPMDALRSDNPAVQSAVQRVNATAEALAQMDNPQRVQIAENNIQQNDISPSLDAVVKPSENKIEYDPYGLHGNSPAQEEVKNQTQNSGGYDPYGITDKSQETVKTPEETTKQSVINSELGQLQDFVTGATLGWGPRIGEDLATGLEYAAGVLTPGKGRDLSEINTHNEEIRKRLFEPQEQFNTEHPYIGAAIQGGGALTSGGALVNLAKSALPEGIVNAASKFAESNPLWTTAGVSGGTGGIYAAGTTEGTPAERATAAGITGVTSSIAGPALSLLASKVVAPVLSKAGSALGSIANKFLNPVSETAIATDTPIINIPTAPIAEPIAEQSAQTGAKIIAPDGSLPLSEGQKTGNSNLLRIEEKARQGEMGHDLEQQVKGSDLAVSDKAKNIVGYLKGDPDANHADLLTSTIEDFRSAGSSAKAEAQGLFKQRDDALKNAVAVKQNVGFSLGKDLDGLMQEEKYSFASKANSGAEDLYQQFKDMVTSPGKELPMGQYTAWRKNVSDLALANQGNQNGYLAGEIGKIADNWVENKLTPNMILSGDPNIGNLINNAKAGWARYKSMYEPDTFRGKSPVIANITQQYAKPPEDFVQGVFGSSGYGTNATASIVRNMQKSIPESHQQKFADNIFSGLVDRVFEKSNKSGDINLGALGDGLSALKNSNVYKGILSNAEREKILTNLISDINAYTKALNDRTVRAPSGGYIMRGVHSLVELPGVNKIPIAGRVSEIIGHTQEAQQSLQDKIVLQKSLNDAALRAKGIASTGKMFDPVTMGIVGGTISGNNTDRILKGE